MKRAYFLYPIVIFFVVGLYILTQEASGLRQFTVDTENDSSVVSFEINYFEERERLLEDIHTYGAQKAYDIFKEDTKEFREPQVQHLISHVMGELLYDTEGVDGLVVCDASFSSGCYHTFFGKSIAEEGEQIISEFSRICVDMYGPLEDKCRHGIGHGILVFLGAEELSEALILCDRFVQRDIFGCTSGVFMEYFFMEYFTPTSDTESYNKVVQELFNENEPYALCSSVLEHFQESCYYEIVNLWNIVFRQDYEKIKELCTGIINSNSKRELCFLGLGGIIVSSYNFNINRIITFCESIRVSGASDICKVGASWHLYILDSQEYKDGSDRICKTLDRYPDKYVCEE